MGVIVNTSYRQDRNDHDQRQYPEKKSFVYDLILLSLAWIKRKRLYSTGVQPLIDLLRSQ